MSLDLLPAELILDIVERLDPSSALPFALTSRAHFRLLKDKLWQHAKLSATYSAIRPTNDGHLIWEVTKEILQDPCKGWYVRELDLGTNRPSEYENMPEEDRGLFKAAIEKIMPLYPYAPGFFAGDTDATDLSDKMDADLRSGFEGCILVLLVHHSPQLRIIRMTDNLKSWTFELFIHWVAAAYQDPSLAPQMPLQHLHLAAIAHYDPESFCTVDWAVNFLCIPSLKTFAAFMMGSEGAHMYGEEYEAALRMSAITPVSNVEELFFQGCTFDANSFDTILPLIKDLKRFTYNAGDYTVPGGRYDIHLYNGKKVIRALVNHAANSLEELNLVDISAGYVDGEDDVSFVSARGFKKLKALHCELGWLLHDPNDISTDGSSSKDHHSMDDFDEVGLAYLKDPRDNLPKSLEYLYLDIHNKREFEELVKIFETSNANTPKLTLESSCMERFNKSTKYGRAVGPQVQFANPLFDDIWRGHSYFV